MQQHCRFVLLAESKHVKTGTADSSPMKIKHHTNMAKKATKKAAKAASKKSTMKPRCGSHPNALGLEGRGVEVPVIEEINDAVHDYELIMRQRVKLTAKEVPAKQLVVSLMEKHEDVLRNPSTGTLQYHLDDKRYIEIMPAKVQIKFKEDKPKKAKRNKVEDTNDLEPEEQAARDAENQD